MTGVNAFLGFQSDIFKAAGYQEDSIASIPTGPGFIIQMVFVVGSVTGLLLIDSSFGGRKIQLVGASFLMGPPLIIAAMLSWMDTAHNVVGYMVYVFSFGFQAAWGIVPWFYPAELFQMNERERALSVSTFFGFTFNLIVGFVTCNVPLESGWYVLHLWMSQCHKLHLRYHLPEGNKGCSSGVYPCNVWSSGH